MSRHQLVTIVGTLTVILALVLTACAPAATPTPAPAASPTPPPAATPTPPPAPTPTPKAEITRGGTMIMGYSELPATLPNLNPYTGTGFGIFHPWQQPVLQGLLSWDPDGNPVPALAIEVPTRENGGVSEDGKTITYHLRQNVKWADEEPFTCEDVKFTIESHHNPANILHSHEGSEYVEEVQCPDDLTAVFKFKEYYAPWATVPELILPAHALSQYPDMNDVPWNNKIFGTGPFMVTEIVPGDHITFEPNPYYWEMGADGKPLPYLDKFIILFIPDMSAGLERFAAGEIDAYYYTEEDKLAQVRTMPEGTYELVKPQGNDYMYAYVNLSPSSGPHMGDAKYTNPVLGDVRVRQAVDMAIDKQAIIDRFRGGEGFPIASQYFVGQFAPDLKPRPYDPEGAKRLLEEAGWIDTDGDGIRECHGCMYANEGDRASLKLVTTTDVKSALLTFEYMQEALKNVGFDVSLEAVQASLLWATRDAGGIFTGGAYDIAWCGDKCTPDPQGQLFRDYHSSNAECITQPWCSNWSRYVKPEMDALLEAAATERDPEARKEILNKIYKMGYEDVPLIFLNSRSRMAIVKPHIKGMAGPYEKANGFLWATTYIHYVHLEK